MDFINKLDFLKYIPCSDFRVANCRTFFHSTIFSAFVFFCLVSYPFFSFAYQHNTVRSRRSPFNFKLPLCFSHHISLHCQCSYRRVGWMCTSVHITKNSSILISKNKFKLCTLGHNHRLISFCYSTFAYRLENRNLLICKFNANHLPCHF